MEFFSQTTEIYVWAFALLLLVFVQQMCRCAALKEKAEQWEARAKEWEKSSEWKQEKIIALTNQLHNYLLPVPDFITLTKEEEPQP